MTAGLEHNRQHLDSDTVYDKASRTQDSARLGYTGEFGRHQVQLALRQDRYTDFGSPSTWLGSWAVWLATTVAFIGRGSTHTPRSGR